MSLQISLIGAPLTVPRAQKPEETAPVATSTVSAARFMSCSCRCILPKKKKITFSLGSARTQIKKGTYANIYANAAKPITWPHGARVAISLSENFSPMLALMYVSHVLKICNNEKKKKTLKAKVLGQI